MLSLKLHTFDVQTTKSQFNLAQTHTCDFHMFHINLILKIYFFLKKS
jgi:hypothetical protein